MVLNLHDKGELSSMEGDFVEARFDPKFKSLFQEKLEDFDAEKIGKLKEIPVSFVGTFEENVQKALQSILNQAFILSDHYGLKLEFTHPKIHFYTKATWEEQSQVILGKKSKLPAAKILIQSSHPIIQIIVPEEINSSEAVINTIRLACSKLFGELYFREHVPVRPVYRVSKQQIDNSSFGTEEKVRFSRLFDKYPPVAEKHFISVAKQLGIRGINVSLQGKKELYRLLLTEREPKKSYQNVLKIIFEDHIKSFQKDHSLFLDEGLKTIFRTLPQTGTILPHEKRNFEFLKKQENWTVFYALEERVQYLLNTVDELLEYKGYLEGISLEKKLDPNMAQMLTASLKERMYVMKKNGWIKEFLIRSAKLNKNQALKKAQFPLWIWHNVLQKDDSYKGLPPEKAVQKITNQYDNSIYLKLFEIAQRLQMSLQEMSQNPNTLYANTKGFAELKSLYSWVSARTEGLRDVLHSCHILLSFAQCIDDNSEEKTKMIIDFEKGWSYFISFSLLFLYYQKLESKKKLKEKRSEQYKQVISNYLAKHEDKRAYQIAALFKSMFEHYEYDLSSMTAYITEEVPSLDFFVQNNKQIFEQAESSKSAIEHYQKVLVEWFEGRKKEEITTEELQRLSS